MEQTRKTKIENFNSYDIPDRISKNRLKGILGISAPTVHRYSNIAGHIPDFENDYPSITRDSPAITSAPLTRYQAWVIYCLIVVSRELTAKQVEKALKTGLNPDFTAKFSKTYFQTFENKKIGVNLCK